MMIMRLIFLLGLSLTSYMVWALEAVDVGAYIREPYPHNPGVFWLDNERILFVGQLADSQAPSATGDVFSRTPYTNNLMEFNLTTRKIKDMGVVGSWLCYDDGYVRYARPESEAEVGINGPLQPFYGLYGSEQPIPKISDDRRGRRPTSRCQWDIDFPIPRGDADHIYRRLRPEHGYLEFNRTPVPPHYTREYLGKL